MSRLTMQNEKGFSLLEILVVVVVFTVLTAAVFLLLDTAQQRYRIESEVLDSFQSARLGLDQMTRDIHTAGYPPASSYASAAIAAANPQRVADAPFAWSPGYPVAPCNLGGCTVPNGNDLIVETDLDPERGNGVEWVRYQLRGTILSRGVVPKGLPGADPDAFTQPAMVPYVENVVNAVPVFAYTVDAGKANQPRFIREVNITLVVRAPNPDPKTGQIRTVTLTGRARRINPSE